MLIFIQGLTYSTRISYPAKYKDISIYFTHDGWIFDKEFSTEEFNFTLYYKQVIEEFCYVYSNLSQDEIQEVFDNFPFITNLDYTSNILYYTSYLLNSYFKPDKFIDLDEIFLTTTGSFNDKMEAVSSALNTIEQTDEVLYSYTRHSFCVQMNCHWNLKLLDKIRCKTKNLYVGGTGVNDMGVNDSLPMSKLKSFNLVKGSNLTKFTKSRCTLDNRDFEEYLQFHDNYTNLLDNKYVETFGDIKMRTLVYHISGYTTCTGRCAFCSNSCVVKKFKKQDYSKSCDNLKSYYENGFNGVILIDPNLLDPYIFDTVYNYIMKNNIKMSIFCGTCLKDISVEKAIALQELGVKAVNVGIEASNNEHLQYIRKNLTLTQIEEKLTALHQNNIFIQTNFIFNMPYARKTEVQDLINLLDSYEDGLINGVQHSIFSLYKGIHLYDDPTKFHIKIQSHKNYSLYLEEISKQYNNLPRLKNTMETYKKYFDRFNRCDCYINYIFALYAKYTEKRIVWRYYSEFLKTKELVGFSGSEL